MIPLMNFDDTWLGPNVWGPRLLGWRKLNLVISITHQLSKLWQARATWCIWCYLFNLNNRACQALFNSHFPHPSYIWLLFDEFRSPKEQESNLFPTQPFGVLFGAGLPKFISYFPQASLIKIIDPSLGDLWMVYPVYPIASCGLGFL